MEKKYIGNIIKYLIRSCLNTVTFLFATGTMLQTFLAYLGVSSGTIGLHASLINIVNVLTTMLCAGASDRVTNVKQKITLSLLPVSVCFLGYLPLCLISGVTVGQAFAVVLLLSVLQMIFLAIYGIYNYKLPYQIFDLKSYSLIISVEMVVAGVFSVGIGLCINLVFAMFPEKYVFCGAFIACTLMCLLAALLNHLMRDNENASASAHVRAEKKYTPMDLVRLPVFSRLIASNFLRGIATGFLSIAAVFALLRGFSGTQVSYLVTASSIATLVGGSLYVGLSRWISSRAFCLIGGLLHLFLIIMPLGSVPQFIVCYFLAYMGRIIVDTAIPALLYEVVPFELSGAYNAWRMILTTAGTALAAGVGGYLAEILPIWSILTVAAACQVFSSLLYYKGSWRRSVQPVTQG